MSEVRLQQGPTDLYTPCSICSSTLCPTLYFCWYGLVCQLVMPVCARQDLALWSVSRHEKYDTDLRCVGILALEFPLSQLQLLLYLRRIVMCVEAGIAV